MVANRPQHSTKPQEGARDIRIRGHMHFISALFKKIYITTKFTPDSLKFPNSNFLIFHSTVEFTYRTTTRCMQSKQNLNKKRRMAMYMKEITEGTERGR
jgi:hypothetical protein